MFNTKIFDRSIKFPGKIEITATEKRAPTDESVRLLQEMEEAALKRLVQRSVLRDNRLSAEWQVFDDFGELEVGKRVIVRLSVNGKECDFDFTLWPRDFMAEGPIRLKPEAVIADRVRAEVIGKLAELLTVEFFRGAYTKIKGE
jgi:hypothetical protein